PQGGAGGLQVVGGPQPREAGADDRDVGLRGPGQRGAGRGLATHRVPPEAQFPRPHFASLDGGSGYHRTVRRWEAGFGEESAMEAAVSRAPGGERTAAGAATIAEAFRITAAERAGEVAIRTKEDAFTITWGELRERVDALAGGLHGLGLGRGQTLALMLSNRPEF